MKRLFILPVVALAFVISGCTKWLDVEPEDRILEDKAYSTEANINNVLNGLYRTMTGDGLYGNNLTAGTVDFLAHYYAYPESDPSSTVLSNLSVLWRLGIYDYNDNSVRKDYINPVWTNGYRFIMQVNQFIRQMENLEPGIMDENRRKLYLGEAYGLRAMMHLDLYRFFGPTTVVGDKKALPYHGSAEIEIPDYLTPIAFLGKVKDDINTASTLLRENDPIVLDEKVWDGREDDNNISSEARFAKMFRNKRMNYWAVQVLKARTHMLLGEYGDVVTVADDLLTNAVDAGYKDKTFTLNPMIQKEKPFGWTPRLSNSWTTNSILYDEVIFGPSKMDQETWWKKLFNATQATGNEGKNNRLVIRSNLFNNLSTDPINAEDLRRAQWSVAPMMEELVLLAVEDYYRSNKFSPEVVKNGSNTKGNLVYNIYNMRSLMRLSEVQYMKAEALLKSGDVSGAITAINFVLEQRGFTISGAFSTNLMMPSTATEAEVWQMLKTEYYREFVMEGQAWFFLKRNRDTSVMTGYDGTTISTALWREANYVPLIPEVEGDFYNLEDKEDTTR